MCPRNRLGLCSTQIVPHLLRLNTLQSWSGPHAADASGSSAHIPIFLEVTSGLSWLTSPSSPDPVSVPLGSESAVRSKVLRQEQVFKAETIAPLTSAPWVNAGSPPDTGSPRRLCSLSLWIYSNTNVPAIFLPLF